MKKNSKNQPPSPAVIYIGKHKSKHDEDHGSHGVWKIAYADFMTAMMAFFLMMWLTSSVAENIRVGISDYFAPIGASNNVIGSESILDGGESLEKLGKLEKLALEQNIFPNAVDQPTQPPDAESISQNNQNDFLTHAANAAREQLVLEEAQKAIQGALTKDPALQKIAGSILMDITADGLKIELIDKDGLNMFAIGSKEMLHHTKLALAQIAKVIQVLPNKVSITGHTDARPYGANAIYNNWDLSTDRALESRRFLETNGFPASKIEAVVGKASNELLSPENPFAPSNRRISILVLRNAQQPRARLP